MKRSERVFYDLTESTEFIELEKTRFYFSSSFNKDRFLKGYETFMKEEEDKFKAKYGINVANKYNLLIAFYMKIEKRGFYLKRWSEYSKDYDIILLRNNIIPETEV